MSLLVQSPVKPRLCSAMLLPLQVAGAGAQAASSSCAMSWCLEAALPGAQKISSLSCPPGEGKLQQIPPLVFKARMFSLMVVLFPRETDVL